MAEEIDQLIFLRKVRYDNDPFYKTRNPLLIVDKDGADRMMSTVLKNVKFYNFGQLRLFLKWLADYATKTYHQDYSRKPNLLTAGEDVVNYLLKMIKGHVE